MVVPKRYKKTEVGIIPIDWDCVILDDIFEITSSKRVFQSDWCSSGVPFYRARELAILSESGRVNNELYISKELYNDYTHKYGAINPGDILITGVGTLGKVYVIRGGDTFYFKDGNIIWLKPKKEVNSYYIRHLYYTPQVISQVFGSSAGTTVGTYTITNAKLTKVPIPSIKEQTAIAEALSDTDNMIASLEKLISKKKAIKQGAMQELLTGKRRLTGFDGKWIEFNLVTNSKLKARIGWQGLTTAEYLAKGKYILITGTDFENGKINWATCSYVKKKRYDQDPNIQIKDRDVLVTKDGTIGKVALVDKLPKPGTLNSGVFVIRPLNDTSYLPEFIYHILSSSLFTDFLNKLSAGSTINHLYQKDLGGFSFLVPYMIEEQIAIASILCDMDVEIEQLDKKLAKFQLIKQGMMQELLTGRIRLVEPYIL